MEEIWKPIEGYENFYLVSNLGKIKSIRNNIIMKPQKLYNGYEIVGLSKNGTTTRKTVHRLVATAFISNIYGKTQINHINGIRNDNRLINLEWCTPKENIYDAITRNSMNGYQNVGGQPKKVKQYSLNNKFIKEWNSIKEAGNELHISQGNIVNCCKNKRYTAGNYIWKYCS